MERRILPAIFASGLLAVLLSACTTAAVQTVGQPTSSGAVVPAETATATDAAEAPVADPGPASATCETVLTGDEYARLADDGLGLDDRQPYLLGPVMERMAAAGALVCVWNKPASDVSVWYARLAVGADGEAWLTELEAEGWLEDTERGDGTFLAPADYDSNYQPSVQLRDGVLHFASYNRFLESVLELQ